ncbi:heterokaryon incompatibility protein-domain-containing protein [Xylaria sp. FL0933]|nr:heterokaryon incompatibility protein-domain-containing protein [Xylaria sp. FL0933]
MTAIASDDRCSPQPVLYFPLDHTRPQIRLIKILPFEHTDNEQVSCQLKTIELSQDTRYAALSYVWGDPKITEQVKVNGINLPVTTNLTSALRHFRRHGFPQNQETKDLQYLWVDAICINQDENGISERNHQVALMSKIYSSATSVLSWLGTHNSRYVEKALEIIHDIAPVIDAKPYPSYFPMNAERTYSGFRWLNSTLPSPIKDKSRPPMEWASIRALRTNVYWERIWIVQEMALVRSPWNHWFICGNASATFHELRMFTQLLKSIGKTPYPKSDGPQSLEKLNWEVLSELVGHYTLPTQGVDNLRGVAQNVPIAVAYWSSIFCFACIIALTCSASRPHDCVYAILGIFTRHNINPDYGKPVKEVYLNALSGGMAREWDLYLLISGRGLNMTDEHDLPSWLPNLSKLHNSRASDFLVKKSMSILSDSLVSEAEVLPENILCVDGVICGRVELVKHLNFIVGNEKHNKNAFAKLCIDYLAEFFGSSCSAFTPEQESRYGQLTEDIAGRRPLKALLDVLDWRERHSGKKGARHHSVPGLSSVAWYSLRLESGLTDEEEKGARRRLGLPVGMALSDYLQSCFDPDSLHVMDVNNSSLSTFVVMEEFHELLGSLAEKCLFTTRTGYLGIGPPGMKPGDCVCAVHPCSLPVLLRKAAKPRGQTYLEHVGACYVLGISDGELADKVANGELKIWKLTIQ